MEKEERVVTFQNQRQKNLKPLWKQWNLKEMNKQKSTQADVWNNAWNKAKQEHDERQKMF